MVNFLTKAARKWWKSGFIEPSIKSIQLLRTEIRKTSDLQEVSPRDSIEFLEKSYPESDDRKLPGGHVSKYTYILGRGFNNFNTDLCYVDFELK